MSLCRSSAVHQPRTISWLELAHRNHRLARMQRAAPSTRLDQRKGHLLLLVLLSASIGSTPLHLEISLSDAGTCMVGVGRGPLPLQYTFTAILAMQLEQLLRAAPESQWHESTGSRKLRSRPQARSVISKDVASCSLPHHDAPDISVPGNASDERSPLTGWGRVKLPLADVCDCDACLR